MKENNKTDIKLFIKELVNYDNMLYYILLDLERLYKKIEDLRDMIVEERKYWIKELKKIEEKEVNNED